jgi:hypothetical protein
MPKRQITPNRQRLCPGPGSWRREKRIGFGFRNFENYRVRALLHTGRLNWQVPGSIVVR